MTDVMIPSGGGSSLLEQLTMSFNTNTIPIIVLTGSPDPEVETRVLAAGAMRVLRKPCEPAVLLEAVGAAIGGRA